MSVRSIVWMAVALLAAAVITSLITQAVGTASIALLLCAVILIGLSAVAAAIEAGRK